MNETARQGDRRMTVREVAEVLGVTDEAIKKHIRELWPDLMRNGVITYLSESQVAEIKQKMLPTTKVVGALTSIDIERMTLQVIEYHTAKIKELEARNAELEPKAEFFDQVADSKDAMQMRDVAAALNIPGLGRNKIFERLRKDGVFDDRNIPYREYQDRGYFRVVEQKWTDKEGDTHINLKTLVYQRGIDFIRKALRQEAV